MKIEQLTMILGKYAILFQGYQLSGEIIKSWFDIFSKTSIKEFEGSFKRVITQPGRKFFPAPGELQEELNREPNQGFSREYQSISKAPKFQGEKFLDLDRGIPTNAYDSWRELEKANRYEAIDHNGDIFLIQNPDAWDWTLKDGQICFIRDIPYPTGEKRIANHGYGRRRE